MVHIVTISSSKGGAGKTTTTISLADYWSQLGVRVGLIDTDPNKSLSRWFEKGRDKGFFDNIIFRQELQDKKLIETARELAAVSDVLLIDVAGIASISLLKAAGLADLVIIPAQPSEDDFLEAINTCGIVKEAMELTGRTIPYRTLLTRAKAGTTVFRHTLEQLEKIKFPMFKSVIFDRTVYQQARYNGLTPISYEPNGPGASDIAAFGDEVLDYLGALQDIPVPEKQEAA
jgi:chromosome partitioning protein